MGGGSPSPPMFTIWPVSAFSKEKLPYFANKTIQVLNCRNCFFLQKHCNLRSSHLLRSSLYFWKLTDLCVIHFHSSSVIFLINILICPTIVCVCSVLLFGADHLLNKLNLIEAHQIGRYQILLSTLQCFFKIRS